VRHVPHAPFCYRNAVNFFFKLVSINTNEFQENRTHCAMWPQHQFRTGKILGIPFTYILKKQEPLFQDATVKISSNTQKG
jgi:hypothetical protein